MQGDSDQLLLDEIIKQLHRLYNHIYYAPLAELPEYLVHMNPLVRQKAEARLEELGREKL